MARLQALGSNNQHNQNCDEEKVLKNRIAVLWRNEEIYWKQRSRVKWLNQGDRNSKFFHQSTLDRRRRNKILKIRDEGGQWIEEESGIISEIHTFFSTLFSSDRPAGREPTGCEAILNCLPNDVTEDMNTLLTKEVTESEVRQAVNQLGGSRAPGPDGFSGAFYQRSWKVVGTDILTMV